MLISNAYKVQFVPHSKHSPSQLWTWIG